MTTQHAPVEPATLTVEEAAKYLRISRASAYEGVRAGDIPSVRIGRRIVVSRRALDRLLDGDQLGATRSENANDPA
jgi:excisionase family DNA binding protein